MFKRLFGSKKKDEPGTTKEKPPKQEYPKLAIMPSEETYGEPPRGMKFDIPISHRDLSLEIDPEKLEKLSSQITEFLMDVGLDQDEIVDAWHAIGGDNGLEDEYGTSVSYLATAYWDLYPKDSLSMILQREHRIMWELMVSSRLGFTCELKEFDSEFLESALRPSLSSFGVKVDFSDHAWEEDYTITFSKGELIRTTEVDHSVDEGNTSDKMELIASLVRDFGFVYLDLSVRANPFISYFLFEEENLKYIRKKYGKSFDEALRKE